MTSHWEDMENADYILTCGSNNAENHPVSMKWVNRALDKGATWIVVDPRFTRTAALADIYCPIRSGTDIAFYGGMINYIFEHDRYQHEYCLNYTNLSYLINPDFSYDPETGLFSGWNEETKSYDQSTWGYQTDTETPWDTETTYAWVKGEGVPEFDPPVLKTPKKDPTLKDPNCVYQIMKKHYSRYTIDAVCNICGMDPETLELVYDTYTKSGEPGKAGTILYALGQTQHHYGANNTRIMSVIQLLLGNIGVPGGGLNALRGEPNVQGCTDMCIMPADLPGYLHWPTSDGTPSLKAWCEHETYSDGYYTNKPKFMVSFLKSWFGENATFKNDYGYDWLPKVYKPGNWTSMRTFEHMAEGTMHGYFALGQNPAHSSGNTKSVRESLAHLDWLVCADLYMTETASFWNAPDMKDKAADIQTECYFLPVASIMEKPGTILNSGRLLQWRQEAVPPAEGTKTDLEIMDLLHKKVVELYEKEGGVCPEPILKQKWDYDIDGKVDFRAVAWELNGYQVNRLDESFTETERLRMTPEGFARERLGWWSDFATVRAVFGAAEWEKCRTMTPPCPKEDEKICYGVKFTPDDAEVAISVATMQKGIPIHVECTEFRSMSDGIAWVSSWLVGRKEKCSAVMIDGRANAAALVQRLIDDGFPKRAIMVTRTQDAMAAAITFRDAVRNGDVTHFGQEALTNSALSAQKRSIGNEGGWGFGSGRFSCAPVESCALAYYAVKTTKRHAGRKQRMIR